MKKPAHLVLAYALLLAACDRDDAPAVEPAATGAPAATSSTAAGSPYAAIDELLKKRDVDVAVRRLDALRAERGPEPQLVLRLGRALVAQGNAARAVIRYKECLALHPDAVAVHTALGDAYLGLGLSAEALAAYRAARAAGGKDAQLAISIGTCLGRSGDLEGAEREFEAARALGGDENTIDFDIALIYGQRQQHDAARVKLEKVIASDATYAPAKRELARVLLAMRPEDPETVDRAMGLAMDAKDALPEDWRAFEVLGDGFLVQAEYEAAVAMYTDALRLGRNPKQVEDKYVVAKKKMNEANAAKAPAGDGAAPH